MIKKLFRTSLLFLLTITMSCTIINVSVRAEEEPEEVLESDNELDVDEGEDFHHEDDFVVEDIDEESDVYLQPAESNLDPVLETETPSQIEEEGLDEQQLGFVEIDTYVYYYVTASEMAYGRIEIDGCSYYFDEQSGALLKGFVKLDNGNIIYANSEGVLQTGFQVVNGKKRYFDQTTGYLLKGFQTIKNKKYYFDKNGVMKTGWQTINKKKYYFDSKGVMAANGMKVISKKKYLFGTNGVRISGSGWKKVGKNYYYLQKGYAVTGWKKVGKYWYYMNKKGIRLKNSWISKKYYVNSKGRMVTGRVKINGVYYSFNSKGALLKKKAIVYQNQLSSPQANYKVGGLTFGSTSCAQTCLSMAYTSILNKTVTAYQIGKYLHKKKQYNNNGFVGTSGKGIVVAAKGYKINYSYIKSNADLTAALKSGKLVFAGMNYGTFCYSKGATHAILCKGYKNGKTYVYDPANSGRNGWYSISTIWKQRSTDPLDIYNGTPIFAMW